MTLASALAQLKADVLQCSNLIANSHKIVGGSILLPGRDREQIVAAAFINLFVAWEGFLEDSLAEFLVGAKTLGNTAPTSYVKVPDADAARRLVVGTQRFFDYGNHDFVRKIVNIYFKDGYPYEPHLSAASGELADMRTIRNSAAHISSSTQMALESLAQRLFVTPKPGITVYTLLTTNKPGHTGTVYSHYSALIVALAELIANG